MQKKGCGKYSVPSKLSDGSWNPEYTLKLRRARGIPPRTQKYSVPVRLPNGSRNPEYAHRSYIAQKPRMLEISRFSRWKSYGITDLEEAERIYQSSNNCALCGKPISGKNKHLDHDHKTKVIRGVLCSNCNLALGGFEDNIELLKATVLYLGKYLLAS